MIDTTKIIHAPVGGGRYTVTAPIVKEDYGLYLKIEGLELPQTYEVDFSNSEHNGTSVTMIGNADGVLIPHQFIDTGKDIFAFLYHVGADYGRTIYKFRIPNKLRPDRTNEQPTPEQQSVIDQAISALNEAVAKTAQDVIDANASAQAAGYDADRAEEARGASLDYAEQAEASATSASNSANSASASATASAQSAQSAETARQETTSLVAEAQRYADASEQSATNAHTYALSANAASGTAENFADVASGYASSAQISAQTASSKASEASGHASTASTKASESAQSASQALTYKTDAESAKTASQTAQGLAESARDTAVQAKNDAESAKDEAQNLVDGISGKVEQIDQNTADIASLEDDRYKPYVVDSASGSIASFPDGADNLPLKSLTVDIDPVQDLHGYDSPWVAGGGKNLLAPTFYDGIGYNVAVGTVLTITEATGVTASGNTYTRTVGNWGGFGMRSPQLALGTYYLMAELASPNMRSSIYVLNSDMSVSRNLGNQGSGTTRSIGTVITLSGDEAYIAFNCLTSTAGDVSISTPMVALSSTATTYAPYENICPISGWTGMQLTQANENLIPESLPDSVIKGTVSNGKIISASNARLFAFPVPKNTPLHVQKISGDTSGGNIGLLEDGEPQVGDAWIENKGITGAIDQDYTANEYSWMGIGSSTLEATEAFFTTRELMVSVGNSRKEYVAPKGYSTRHISWQTEAGTVYGGTLDVLSGVLRVDRKTVTLDENNNWTMYASGKFYCKSLDANEASLEVSQYISNQYLFSGTGDTSSNAVNVDKRFYGQRRYGRFWVYDSAYASLDSFLSALTTSNLQIVYPLATPIEIQLDAHTLNSLYGYNNIWADTGDTEVEYRADTRLYIEKLTQPEEDDMVADSAITSGQFFMVGNSLYRALANIASGATITVGTNAQRVSLSDALNLVNT